MLFLSSSLKDALKVALGMAAASFFCPKRQKRYSEQPDPQGNAQKNIFPFLIDIVHEMLPTQTTRISLEYSRFLRSV